MLSKKNIDIDLSNLDANNEESSGQISPIFDRVMAKVRAHIGVETFNSWFSKLHFIQLEAC
ncbi:MAG: hypothetical protein QWI73_00765, partial [Alphaproteobacteria bacterium]|nr:hypothetical protein [Alphaproteobacteria bacterium]